MRRHALSVVGSSRRWWTTRSRSSGGREDNIVVCIRADRRWLRRGSRFPCSLSVLSSIPHHYRSVRTSRAVTASHISFWQVSRAHSPSVAESSIDHDLHTKSNHDVYLRWRPRIIPCAKLFRTWTLVSAKKKLRDFALDRRCARRSL
jgi:hypothetical protein